MKNIKRITNRERRQALAKQVFPDVRKLVLKFDLAAVHNAVKAIYDERTAQKELLKAEAEKL